MSIQLFYVRKELPLKKYLLDCYVFVCIGVIMFLLIYFVKKQLDNSILSLFTLIFLGGVVYFILTCVYLRYSKSEIAEEVKGQMLEMIRRHKR